MTSREYGRSARTYYSYGPTNPTILPTAHCNAHLQCRVREQYPGQEGTVAATAPYRERTVPYHRSFLAGHRRHGHRVYVQTCPNGDGGEAKLLGKTFGIGMDAVRRYFFGE